jgi:hypothetical protein
MSINTLVSWQEPIPAEIKNAVDAEANSRAALQTQIGGENVLPPKFGEGTTCWRRFWIDQSSAESWVTFVQAYSPIEAIVEN